jgi:hypothetical protein
MYDLLMPTKELSTIVFEISSKIFFVQFSIKY